MHSMDFSQFDFGERMRLCVEEVMHQGGVARTEARESGMPAFFDA